MKSYVLIPLMINCSINANGWWYNNILQSSYAQALSSKGMCEKYTLSEPVFVSIHQLTAKMTLAMKGIAQLYKP